MSLQRALWWSLPIATMLALGCKDSAPPPTATTATAEAVKAPAAPAQTSTAAPGEAAHHKRKGRHGRGIAAMMLHAAQGLADLKDTQKATLVKLGEQLHGEHAGPPTEMKDYHAALVAQVKAGKIEPAKLDPLQAAVDKAQQARQDKEAEVLNGLYAALDPAQRKALVAGVRAKQAEHQAKADADQAKHRLEHLTKELDLDAAQQKKVEALLAKDDHPMDAMKQHADAVLTAFEGEGFDAKKLEAAPGAGKKGMAQHAQFIAALLPLLKPEQREKFAAGLEKSPHAQPGGGGEAAPTGEAPAEDPASESGGW